jgi:chloramphenicol 3-O phosphotransferase
VSGDARQPGKIILLNGASSAGKSTLAAALQARLEQPFWHYSIDHLRAARVLPSSRIDTGEFNWADMREQFFAGFHATIPALAAAGNNLLVEHIVENADWMARLLGLLRGFDVFFVGLHCPLEELQRRERERGDRRIGEAQADYETTHTFCLYDLEITSLAPVEVNVSRIIAVWSSRRAPVAFERMAALHDAA